MHKTFYYEEDIDIAKKLMYEKYGCSEQAKVHRGINKPLNDLKEMVTFMAQNAAPSCIFCITSCTQVPAVVMDFVDAVSLNRHITNLRGEVTVSSATLQRLVKRVELLESQVQHPVQHAQEPGQDNEAPHMAPPSSNQHPGQSRRQRKPKHRQGHRMQ